MKYKLYKVGAIIAPTPHTIDISDSDLVVRENIIRKVFDIYGFTDTYITYFQANTIGKDISILYQGKHWWKLVPNE